jgi:hypothetical protein
MAPYLSSNSFWQCSRFSPRIVISCVRKKKPSYLVRFRPYLYSLAKPPQGQIAHSGKIHFEGIGNVELLNWDIQKNVTLL